MRRRRLLCEASTAPGPTSFHRREPHRDVASPSPCAATIRDAASPARGPPRWRSSEWWRAGEVPSTVVEPVSHGTGTLGRRPSTGKHGSLLPCWRQERRVCSSRSTTAPPSLRSSYRRTCPSAASSFSPASTGPAATSAAGSQSSPPPDLAVPSAAGSPSHASTGSRRDARSAGVSVARWWGEKPELLFRSGFASLFFRSGFALHHLRKSSWC